ncbi:glycosyl transferase [Mycobacterium antarcticum]|uniref:glycosyltransferase n=1 Tax=Mycolicibacterium sp. TUM20983 TaxID=3023369 RepID=UPI00239F4D5F|nr:nucleotide disphospho-sugar-binding domain-containing protein [Mycolicibacterium sp. TUM20983]GLP74637.1 glycosyl transferase [Mycolicibacterium sp. TUM20983]
MSVILIAACPPIGHVAPLLNVARDLVGRGHDVTFLTSARHADRVRATGATPHPLPLSADYDDNSLDDLPGRAETSGVARVNFDVRHVFVRPLPYQAAALDELMAVTRFDAILADAFFLGILPMLLDDNASRPPVLTYTTTPLFLSSRDTAPGGTGMLPGTGALGRLRNRALNVVAQKVLLRASHRAAETMLEALILPKLPVFLLDSAILADRLIVPTIPEFEYHRSDLPEHVRFVGAVTPEPANGFVPPPWWHELTGDRPVVHVTQGTIDNADLGRLIEPTIEALADEDVTVVVSTGGRPVSQLRGPLPSNTFVAEYIPHDVLLPLVDVMITNGGYGAVQRALMTGVPLIVAGNTEDKPEVAARVEWFGAGVNLKTGVPTAGVVRRAVREVLEDDAYRTAARNLQQAYARRDGVAEIAALLDEVIAERAAAQGPANSACWW